VLFVLFPETRVFGSCQRYIFCYFQDQDASRSFYHILLIPRTGDFYRSSAHTTHFVNSRSRMLLLVLLTILSLGCGSLASSSSAHGKWKKSSSTNVHQAGCTTEFIADKIHYYNSASRVRGKPFFDRQNFCYHFIFLNLHSDDLNSNNRKILPSTITYLNSIVINKVNFSFT
jgi:hypothetical protein